MRSKNLGCCLLVLLVAPCAIGAEPPDPISARLASSSAPVRPISFVRDVSPALTNAGQRLPAERREGKMTLIEAFESGWKA